MRWGRRSERRANHPSLHRRHRGRGPGPHLRRAPAAARPSSATRPDGLLLVGDGQQAVYPGGFTLAEAGVPRHGTCHRAGSQLPERRRRSSRPRSELVDADTYEDLDPAPELRTPRHHHGSGTADTVLHVEGGNDAVVPERAALLSALYWGLLMKRGAAQGTPPSSS